MSDRPKAHIQWKGTDVCMDIWCECGADLHFDGWFAYAVGCPKCGAIYELPTIVQIKKVKKTEYSVQVAEEMGGGW